MLTVTDNDGNTDTVTRSIIISPSLANVPVASFTFPSGLHATTVPITFDASGSTDPDGTIDNYAWNFGDGTTGTGMTASHTYSSEGTYTVTLTVTDNDGYTATATQSIEVIVDTTEPTAVLDEDMVAKDGKKVTFDAGKSTDNVGIVSYDWDFGDGNTGTGKVVTHTYEEGGTYSVTLSVRDASGNIGTFILVITVEGPAAGFPYWILIPIVIAIVVGALLYWYFFLKKKPEETAPKPAKIKMTVDKTQIMADGNSATNITIELQDKEGKPVKALEDTQVNLTSTGGTIKSPVVNVPEGKETGTTLLISSTTTGKVMLSATAKGLDRADTTVTFIEKQRFCMHCGAKMQFTAKYCAECGNSPPSGVDTKACKNCNAVIPTVANFCAECGASQPKE